MDFFKSRHRLGLYLLLLAALAVGLLAATWSVTETGAYLTGESDWQTLAGDYRIGTIDYTVRINDELLLGRSSGGQALLPYKLAVPILGGVKMFDRDAEANGLVSKEFNEGATLARVRVTNYSKNTVDVTAQFTLQDQSTRRGIPSIRALPLPVTLDAASAASFDCRKYILDTLAPYHRPGQTAPANLDELDSAYAAYLSDKDNLLTLEMGLLPGSTAADPGEDGGNLIQDGGSWCCYRDVYLVVWCEYGEGEFNRTAADATGTPRQGRFTATFTVGQLD